MMALIPPTPGLRTIHYWGVSAGKAQIVVTQGDELTVPEGVAEQLIGQSPQFKDGPAPVIETAVEGGDLETAVVKRGPGRPRKS